MKSRGTKLQSRFKVSGRVIALILFFLLHVLHVCLIHDYMYTHTNGAMRSSRVPLDRRLRGVAPFESVCDGSLERHGRGGCVASVLHRCQSLVDPNDAHDAAMRADKYVGLPKQLPPSK